MNANFESGVQVYTKIIADDPAEAFFGTWRYEVTPEFVSTIIINSDMSVSFTTLTGTQFELEFRYDSTTGIGELLRVSDSSLYSYIRIVDQKLELCSKSDFVSINSTYIKVA